MNKVLTPLAMALAGVTAASVGMAVHRLIADPVLAGMFSGAAVALDVFKYAAWPAAAALLEKRRKALAGGLVGCALLFGGVSGWATFDRVVGAVEGRAVSSEQRLADLATIEQESRARVVQLDRQLEPLLEQAAVMRARGMVSKAQELEVSTMARVDEQRAQALSKAEGAARERQQILTSQGVRLPAFFAGVLGIGFALALEIVPVLIFLAGNTPPPPRLPTLQDARLPGEKRKLLAAQEPVNTGEPAEVTAVVPHPKEAKSAPAGRDEDLMKALLAGGQELMKVKDFAKAHSIGNTRASAIYKAAEVAGHIKKTPSGYVVA